ncbi:MAG: SpoIIE family protein phosphatase [Deltaproteobacteria bacterium]|jgi:phosphoserine phosphatase RsbU/P|nr:SpoIIE family protein phosphatase [Deltaproteobacteria bacterium]
MSDNNTYRPMDAVHALSEAIAKAVDPDQIYELILDVVVKMLGVEKASVMTYDPELGALRIAAARGLDEKIIRDAVVKVGEGISGKVFVSREPVLIEDITAQSTEAGRGHYKTSSLISAPVTCFPMKVGEEALGVINVTDRTDGTPFTQDDLTLLTTLTNQAAAYLHISQLMIERQATERLKQQLEIARQIQYRLLPAESPKIGGLDVAGRLITAERVGGDYYDCFIADEKRPSFVVADVSGHSIGAALIMAAFRSAIRAQRDADFSPADMVQRINTILYEDLYQAEQFISMNYVQYIKSRQMIEYTTAGHPPPIIWRSANKTFEETSTEDPLLGIQPKAYFHSKQMVISKGDVILLYTDGITEARNSAGEMFGHDRLIECMEDAVVGTARQIVDVLVENVQSFIDPLPARDDITALVIKLV